MAFGSVPSMHTARHEATRSVRREAFCNASTSRSNCPVRASISKQYVEVLTPTRVNDRAD